MKRERRVACFVPILILILASSLFAGTFQVNSKSAMLMDLTSGRVLYEEDADRQIPPASVTKILTMYMTLEAIKEGRVHPWDEVRISRKADATGGSKMFVKAGERVQLRELFKGMAISSGNDACVAVAEYLGGSTDNFVRQMNIKARSLGMTNTVFKTPNGLPAKGQLTTARDMMRLSTEYLRHFPEALSIHSMKFYTHNHVTTHNRNKLLGTCDGVDGLKTGFVCAAGYNIVATAKRGKTRLVAVVLGAPNPDIRATETRKLLETGFDMVEDNTPTIVADRGNLEPVSDGLVVKQVVKSGHHRHKGHHKIAATRSSRHNKAAVATDSRHKKVKPAKAVAGHHPSAKHQRGQGSAKHSASSQNHKRNARASL